MEKKESLTLTTEFVRQKFKSQFELVNYAIKLAGQMIETGRSPKVRTDNQNPAVITVYEIEDGKDCLEEREIVSEPTIAHIAATTEIESRVTRPTEKKKARRIFV